MTLTTQERPLGVPSFRSQETANIVTEWHTTHNAIDAPKQVAVLDQILREAGYLLHRTPYETPDDNPCLLATRWPVTDGGAFLIDGDYQQTLLEADGQLRSAR